jgi:hypothetical protein
MGGVVQAPLLRRSCGLPVRLAPSEHKSPHEGTDHVEKVGDTVRKTEVEMEDDRNLAANKRQNQR